MSKHQHKLLQPLTGQFLGWGDDSIPHRYIKLATDRGEEVAKVSKRLRPLIQDWQPGIWLSLLSQKRVDLATGETNTKVKQLLTPPRADACPNLPTGVMSVAKDIPHDNFSPMVKTPVTPTQIRVCQGSSCRRRGSEGICKAMQTYLDRHDLTDRVEIKPVKCLHQCKAAPHAIITQPIAENQSEKIHYRQLQNYQVQVILAKHFPVDSPVKSNEDNLIKKIGNYLQQIGSTSSIIENPHN
jgi:Thioredoxin-like [2Fe-2S] ferredoxin